MSGPLWKDEFSVQAADEKYVSRRQFTKYLALTSLGMFVGNLWILGKSWLRPRQAAYPVAAIARADEVPVGGVKLFRYPAENDPCILIRLADGSFVAYSQTCPHLSCSVYYAKERDRIECPCHQGYFDPRDGRVLQGPPPRPLARVLVERRGDQLVATGIAAGGEG